jgi:arginine/lysine/histidine transporter system substrate-binding protein
MINIKKILISLIGLMLLSSCDNQNDDKIIVGTSLDYAPYEYLDESNEISGIDMEIIKYIAKKLDKEIEIKNIDFQGLIPSIKSGHIDLAISAFTKTEDRAKEVDFSIPYYSVKFAILYNAKNIPKSKVKEFFVNSKIDPSKLFGNFGVQSGTNMESFIKSLKQDRDNFDVKSYANNLSMISLLNTNVIDFVIMDSLPAKAFASRNKNLKYIKLHETKFDLGIVFPKNSKLINKVNEIIDDMIDDREIEKIERKISRELDE